MASIPVNNFNTQSDPATPNYNVKGRLDGSDYVQEVDVNILGTPSVTVSGVATSAKQDSIITALSTTNAELGDIASFSANAATETTLTATNGLLSNIDNSTTATSTTLNDIYNAVDGLESLVDLSNSNQTQDAVYSAGRVSISGGVRRDADTSPVSADGDVHPFVFDEVGALKVAARPAGQSATTGTITANGQTIVTDVSRTSNLMMHVSGTFSTVNCTFEGSLNGTTWFAVQAVRTNANTIELTTGNLSAAPPYGWEVSVNGLVQFRVRATAFTSGTQNWIFQPAPYATEPIPAAQISGTQPVSGTVTANLGTGGTAATSLGKAEDAVAASGDTGVAVFAVRRDTPSSDVSAAGDYATLQVNATGSMYVQEVGNTSGGLTAYHLVAANTTNPTVVKASAGQIYSIVLFNDNATLIRKLALHNASSAPTAGAAVFYSIPVPPKQSVEITFPTGLAFSTGIAFTTVGGIADSDTGAIGSNELVINIGYK